MSDDEKSTGWSNYKMIPASTVTKIIKNELASTTKSFVAIGFYLSDAKQYETFKDLGYENFVEYVEKEFGLSESSSSRLIGIHKRFGKEGSPVLLDGYKDFDKSQLREMLPLSDDQIKQVTPDMTVKQIREMKPKKEPKPDKKMERVQSEVLATSQIEKVEGEIVTEPEESVSEQEDNVIETSKNVKMCFFNPKSQCNIAGCSEIAKSFDDVTCQGMCCHGCDDNDKCGARCNNSKYDYNFDVVSMYTIHDVKEKIEVSERNCKALKTEKTIAPICKTERMKMDALKLLMEQMQGKEPKPIQEQPELPVLKNNDQRKEFIDAYTSWPLWIDQSLTGEKYYRYDFGNGISFVVRVSRKHKLDGYKETKEYCYGREEYYLLGAVVEYHSSGYSYKPDSSRTFCECVTNRSGLVDYLKEFQKGMKK